jgi:hypothetical protein
MHHSHTLPVPTRNRAQRLIGLVIGILAAALVVVALAQLGAGTKSASQSLLHRPSAPPATAARPNESGIAATIAAQPESRPSESTIAATLARGRQSDGADEAAVTRRWKAYDAAIRSLSETKGAGPSLSQLKRDAEYLPGR